MDFSKGAAWMRGELVPISEARIGVTDWGLTRSDCTYDVVTVWQGAFFRLADHLDRFEASMAALRLSPAEAHGEMAAALHRIVAAAGLRDAYVAMIASRGTPLIPGTRDPRQCANHFFCWCVPYLSVIRDEVVARGAALKVSEKFRRIPTDSVDPRVKNYHWGDLTGGLFEALDEGFDTALLLDHDGNVTEGPGFNIFALSKGTLVTPDTGVLEGITRRTVREIAREMGIVEEVRPMSHAELLEAEEVFTATSAGGIAPVTRVDGRTYGNGAPGETTRAIMARFDEWRMRPDFRTPVEGLSS